MAGLEVHIVGTAKVVYVWFCVMVVTVPVVSGVAFVLVGQLQYLLRRLGLPRLTIGDRGFYFEWDWRGATYCVPLPRGFSEDGAPRHCWDHRLGIVGAQYYDGEWYAVRRPCDCPRCLEAQ